MAGADTDHHALRSVLTSLADTILRESPERSTALGIAAAGAPPNGNTLDDRSREAMLRRAATCAAAARALDGIKPGGLLTEDRISRDVVLFAMKTAAESATFSWGQFGFDAPRPYVIEQISCAHTVVPPFLDAKHPVARAEDADHYLDRLISYARVLDQETDNFRTDRGKGVVPPDFILERVAQQLQAFAALSPHDTPLIQSLVRKLDSAVSIDRSAARDAIERGLDIVRQHVLPAYARQLDRLRAARASASHAAGVGRLPDGEGYYRAALRAWTSSGLTPFEVHERGTALLAELTGELDRSLKSLGHTGGTVGERMAALTADPSQLFPDSDQGRAQLLQFVNGLIANLQPLLLKYFATIPRSRLEIRRVPQLNESGSSGGYYEVGSDDGSRPGVYYINLRDTAEWPRFLLPTLTYHEGEPGHHWQISIAQESAELPLVRRALLEFAGYVEGWGLYAEDLADEMGVYSDAPLGRLGYLQFAAFRAARLVVDTGIHAKGWSRERAIQFLIEATGRHPNTVATEVDRYCVQPGQACTYMLGREEMRALRSAAKRNLGARFDVRTFHDVVLRHGPLPLPVLRAVVTRELQRGP